MGAQGSNSYIAIQEEPSFATSPVTPAMTVVPFETTTLKGRRPLVENNLMRGTRAPSRPNQSEWEVGGNIVTNLSPYLLHLFYGLLGAKAFDAPTKKWTLTMGNTLPSFLIEHGFPDIGQYFKYRGITVGSASMDITGKGVSKITFDTMGAKAEAPAGTSYHPAMTDLGDHSYFGRHLSTITEGGATLATCSGIKGFKIENQLDGDHYYLGGGGSRGAIYAGKIKISGTISALFANVTLLNKALNSTASSLDIEYKFGDGAGTSGNEGLKFHIPELDYGTEMPVANGPKGVLVELPFTGYYDTGAGGASKAFWMEITNTQTAL